MDRREEKTIETIYQAFTNLINTKDFDDITIQNILDEAKIGRSTFYCHFKTKNDLLLFSNKVISFSGAFEAVGHCRPGAFPLTHSLLHSRLQCRCHCL